MRDELARSRYLTRYAENNLPACQTGHSLWQHVLIVPAYRETPELLNRLALQFMKEDEHLLVILVLNRPDNDPHEDANKALREAAHALPSRVIHSTPETIHALNQNTDLYVCDMELTRGLSPCDEGVGLARKLGCDIALNWIDSGAISSDWLCCTDADAELPADYFCRLAGLPNTTSAATFPFYHQPAADDALSTAAALYELRLHHYVLGLEYTGSAYAIHTLGSCMAIRASAYAHVRGVPRRSAAEDFYLLNKLAKIGKVERLTGACINLTSRSSERVPFGTGPSLAAIQQLPDPLQAEIFYDPQCFITLNALLKSLHSAQDSNWALRSALQKQGLDSQLVEISAAAMEKIGLEKSLEHCRRQCRSQQQFDRHMRQWFDAFRTLKFIHALRDNGMPMLSLQELESSDQTLWPDSWDTAGTLQDRIKAIQQHWQWSAWT